MAARGNLTVSSSLVEAFEKANAEDSTCRYLCAVLDDEAIVLDGEPFQGSDDPAADFETIKATLTANKPRWILFCADLSKANKTFSLVVYVPDGAMVRDKMLYAAGREDIRMKLGQGNFAGDYYFSDLEDCSWESFFESSNKLSGDVTRVMTAEEAQAKAESMAAAAEQSGVATSAIGKFDFALGDGVAAAMKGVQSGEHAWVELCVDGSEKLCVVSAGALAGESVPSRDQIKSSEARFYVMRCAGGEKPTFVSFMCCPEGIPIKDRMVYATVKPTLTAALTAAGIDEEEIKMAQVVDADELLERASELSGTAGGAAEAAAAAAAIGGGAGQQVRSYKRPTARGGRRKRGTRPRKAFAGGDEEA